MHSYEGPSGRTYHHASEGSLEDVIHFEAEGRYPEAHIYSDGRVIVEVTLTMRDVLWLAARFVRDRRIAHLEQAEDTAVLGLTPEELT